MKTLIGKILGQFKGKVIGKIYAWRCVECGLRFWIFERDVHDPTCPDCGGKSYLQDNE